MSEELKKLLSKLLEALNSHDNDKAYNIKQILIDILTQIDIDDLKAFAVFIGANIDDCGDNINCIVGSILKSFMDIKQLELDLLINSLEEIKNKELEENENNNDLGRS